jgi:alpha-tubulin suppressor-like RCC1 family protein
MNKQFLRNIPMSKLRIILVLLSLVGNAFAVVSPPVFSPGSAQTATATGVLATSATAGATIYYTINGNNPTVSDSFVSNGGQIIVPRSLTLKAMAWSVGVSSTVTSATYKVVGQIAAGSNHGIALKSSGYPSAWGYPAVGVLGDLANPAVPQLSPGRMKLTSTAMFSNGKDVAGGGNHSAVIDSSGRVVCYGLNSSGQLGDGTTTTPADFLPRYAWTNYQQELQGAVQVVAASSYTSALGSSGVVYTWGGDSSGRLGRIGAFGFWPYAGLVQKSVSPYPSLSGIVQIAAGESHMLARTSHSYEAAGGLGSVWVWGLNSSGQLGLANTTTFTRATQATLLTNISDISAGPQHSAVVKWNATTPGWVYCIGQRDSGRLGNNLTTSGVVSSPVQVVKSVGVLDQVVAVAAGPQHTLALDSSGFVWAWGRNLNGELGDNSGANRGFASKVKNPAGTGDLSNIVNIAAGGVLNAGFSFATAADGTVYAWGTNLNGQLGIGTVTNSQPLPVIQSALKLTNQGPPSVVFAATASPDYEPSTISLSCSVTDIDGSDDVPFVSYYNGSALVATSYVSDT